MLIVAHTLRELSFSGLMEVYVESNRENGRELWPELPEAQQLLGAEGDFFDYLSQVFFPAPGAFYAMWQENGKYVSALRMEPYQDGLLLEALETAPACRGRGYAIRLIRAMQQQIPGTTVYSHVSRKNTASLAVHKACGFHQVLGYARRMDGSVLHSSVTLQWRREANT